MTEQEKLRELQRRQRTRPLADWEARRYQQMRKLKARTNSSVLGK